MNGVARRQGRRISSRVHRGLIEVAASTGHTVDRDTGMIRDVLILGFNSKNGRTYTPEAMQQAISEGLYEGRHVNIDHPTDGDGNLKPLGYRPAEKRFGKFAGVRFDPQSGIRGNLVYLKSHPMAERVCEAAERMPSAFMFSHNADGEGPKLNGKLKIEHITEVRSVDLVAEGGTTHSLFESNMAKKTYKQAITENKKLSAKQRTAIAKLLEAEGMADEPMAEDDEGDHKQHLLKAVGKLCEEDDSEENHDTINKIMKILNPAPVAEDDEEEPKKEEKKTPEADEEKDKKKDDEKEKVESLNRKIQTMERKDQARTLCESAEFNIIPSPTLLKTLTRCDSEKEMKEVLAEYKANAKPRGTAPRSGAPTLESAGNGVKVTDGKSFASAICG